jgi:hypothetical protein
MVTVVFSSITTGVGSWCPSFHVVSVETSGGDWSFGFPVFWAPLVDPFVSEVPVPPDEQAKANRESAAQAIQFARPTSMRGR